MGKDTERLESPTGWTGLDVGETELAEFLISKGFFDVEGMREHHELRMAALDTLIEWPQILSAARDAARANGCTVKAALMKGILGGIGNEAGCRGCAN